MIRMAVSGIGFFGPGATDWEAAKKIFQQGGTPPSTGETARQFGSHLPPAERRRASDATRLALDVAMEALGTHDPATVTSVFASSGGEIGVTHGILEALCENHPKLSPTAFHNSVHNAASGYFGIASQSRFPTDSVCALDNSFGAGLSECLTRSAQNEKNLLLVAYDLRTPYPIADFRKITSDIAIALFFEGGQAPPLGHLNVQYDPKTAPAKGASHQGVNPVEAAYPLLRAIALGERCKICLSAGLGGMLEVEFIP